MKRMKLLITLALLAMCTAGATAQSSEPEKLILLAENGVGQSDAEKTSVSLDARREKQALRIFLKSVEDQIESAAEAMPATKYEFAPTEGEFKGVRTFARQVRHLSATNHILAAAALGEEPPADAGDENGPETVRTKAEILDYLKSSFVHLGKAIDAIDEPNAMVKSTAISPLPASKTTRLALTVEAMIHAFDHYGQMVEYLRMNGVVPPASRP
ncbi:MAG TPA: DinB family protein [Candidatus Sulfotelmatobacter sp.]|nr:DinB family protein [Candidatus Sulfotelmatobacter sp.]